MKTKLIIILTLIVTLAGCVRYPLPHKKLKPTELCGKDVCDPGNVGHLLHLTKSPFSPALDKATEPEDIAIQILGKTIPSHKIRSSKDYSTCSDLSNNPFTKADINNVRFPGDGREIEFERKEQFEIDVEAATEANLNELSKLTADAAKIDKLEAELRAAYNKVKGKQLTIQGKYSEWELDSDAREKLKKGDGFNSCRKWIEENDQRIILAVGLVYFDITYEENSLDELASEIDAVLEREGIEGSLSFSFKKEVAKRFKSTNDVYQIFIIRHAGIDGKTFVETF